MECGQSDRKVSQIAYLFLIGTTALAESLLDSI